jgi:hypothetical protein
MIHEFVLTPNIANQIGSLLESVSKEAEVFFNMLGTSSSPFLINYVWLIPLRCCSLLYSC